MKIYYKMFLYPKIVSVSNIEKKRNRVIRAELNIDSNSLILSLPYRPMLIKGSDDTLIEWDNFNEKSKSQVVNYIIVYRGKSQSLWFIQVYQYNNMIFNILCKDIDGLPE